MKKIAVADLGEFWYGDYKEPFEQLESAVQGYPKGVILKADDGRLLCPFCGRLYDALGIHASRVHGLPAPAFKAEVGLLSSSALVSERVRHQLVGLAVRRGFAAMAPGFVPRNNRSGGRWQRKPEAQNRTGRCAAQVLAVARSAARARGGRLYRIDLRRRGIGPSVVDQHFGSYEALARIVTADLHRQSRYSEGELLAMLRGIAHELGRTPSTSDLRRYGLPTQVTYSNHFGSLSEACRRAGLVPNLPVPLTGEREIDVLNRYATSGSVRIVAQALRVRTSTITDVLSRYGVQVWHGGEPQPGARAAAREWAGEIARRLAGTAA